MSSLISSSVLLALACSENGQPGAPGAAGEGGMQGPPVQGDGGVSANSGPVIWRTTTGATVAVVSSEVGTDRVWVADTRGYVWRFSAVDGTLSPLPEASPVLYFLSPDCSGTAYVGAPFLARKVFKAWDASAPLRAVPDNPTWTMLFDGGAAGGSQLANGTCTALPGVLFLRAGRAFPASELEPAVPIAVPAQLADIPLHPEVLP
jgi:hypothetical protein